MSFLCTACSDHDLSVIDGASSKPVSPTEQQFQLSPARASPRVFKQNRKVDRKGGLSQSFRKMADVVHLRPKNPKANIERRNSNRSRMLSKFFDSRADEKSRRQSKDELIRRGIYKQENVFGNELKNLRLDDKHGVPQFMVKCISRVEEFIDTVGIYRINGDAAIVQKIRYIIIMEYYASVK